MENAGTIKNSANQDANLDSEVIEPPIAAPASRWRKHFTWGSIAVTLVAAALVLPPLINVGRYQRQVTTLVSRSLGRPVQLSSVELRLLPRPGFILNNLSVAEDPAFGTEPVLTARTVVASIGILSLWKGKLAIDRVSVDDASLNLVQSPQGRWNLESLMTGAQPTFAQNSTGASSSTPGKSASFPYLEATNSRVQLKRGVDKSPYAIMNTDLSLWQADPGQWRVRLRGQPVRTDIEMSWADTGEVRMEATLRAAPELRNMPINLQLEWREAHLGQLSRLVLGNDAGWRGEITADIDVQGTAEAAQTKARFQATGVRREEFAPETPLDLDANCSFEYRHSRNAIHALSCDSALGTGQLHLKAELPGSTDVPTGTPADTPSAMLEVQQVPLQAALDLLHTVRAGFAPGISARGIANGSLIYKPTPDLALPSSAKSNRPSRSNATFRQNPTVSNEPANSLQGAITISGASLKGGELKEALVLPTMSWVPTTTPAGLQTKFTLNLAPLVALPSSAAKTQNSIPANPDANPDANPSSDPHLVATPSSGADTQPAAPSNQAPSTPTAPAANPATSSRATLSPAQELSIRLNVAQSGFSVALKGTVATPRLRSLAYAFGLPHSEGLDSFSGGTSDLDLIGIGPWVETYEQANFDVSNNVTDPEPASEKSTEQPTRVKKSVSSSSSNSAFKLVGNSVPVSNSGNQMSPNLQATGTLEIHHAQWKPSYLAVPADLQQAVVTVNGTHLSFTSEFTYGIAPSVIKATAIVQGLTACEGTDCEPQIQIHFGAIDAATMQAALTGTPSQKLALTPILDQVRDRLHSADKPAWPPMNLNVDADSLVLGQITLSKPLARIRVNKDGDLQLESWQAGILGGEAKGTGSLVWSNTNPADAKPEYELEGSFANINPTAAGNLAGAHWSGSKLGSGINGKGKLKLSGLDWKELASSANGELQFEWAHGLIAAIAAASPQPIHSENVHFDNWTGTLAIQDGQAQLGKNIMITGKRSTSVDGTIPLGGPARFSISPTAQQVAKTTTPATTAPKP